LFEGAACGLPRRFLFFLGNYFSFAIVLQAIPYSSHGRACCAPTTGVFKRNAGGVFKRNAGSVFKRNAGGVFKRNAEGVFKRSAGACAVVLKNSTTPQAPALRLRTTHCSLNMYSNLRKSQLVGRFP
jgi:hypothetical protein